MNLLLTILLLLLTGFANAQTDPIPGAWLMEATSQGDQTPIRVELKIATPGNNLLYPALLNISSGDFSGSYQLLLVKKNANELAIGRHKYVLHEKPFSLGTWTILFNGSFHLGTNSSGNPTLTINRIVAKRYGFIMPPLNGFSDSNRNRAIEMNRLMKETNVALRKVSVLPWRAGAAQNMLHLQTSPTYFGIVDTLVTKDSTLGLYFAENNKADNDTISVTYNGRLIIDRMNINHPAPAPELKLDTGLNILCFFGENFGSIPPNTSKLGLRFAEKNYMLDFTRPENMSATFIVAKIYYYPDGRTKDPDLVAKKTITEKISGRSTKQIDSIRVFSEEITLALWDDAVEDGDSISLQINDEVYMPGIAVKKKPQFIKVKLYPGDNKIFFIADNLGAISPNTSILEIIDGKRRRSYNISTNLGQNNSIKIIYNSAQ